MQLAETKDNGIQDTSPLRLLRFTGPRIKGKFPGALELGSGLVLSFFAVLNLFAFKLIVGLDVFSPVSYDLKYLFCIVFSLGALALLYFSTGWVFAGARASLRKHRISKEICLALALGINACYVAASLFLNFDEFSQELGYQSLIFLVFVACLERFLATAFFKEIAALSRFEPVRIGNEVRVLKKGMPGAGESGQLSVQVDGGVSEQMCGVETLQPGDIFRVGRGDVIPCDAVIVKGGCELRERKLSGLASLRVKDAGAEVFAGSLVVSGEMDCKVLSSLEDSRVTSFASDLNAMIEQSEREQKKLGFLDYTLNAVLLVLAGGAGVYWYLADRPWSFICGVMSAVLLVLVVPSLLGMLPYLRSLALTRAFVQGAFLKSAEVLDKLAELKTLVVDYAFSNPPGHARAVNFEILDQRIAEEALISTLLALMGSSDREFDEAAAEYLRERVKQTVAHPVSEFRFFPGKGVSGVVRGTEFSVGSEEFLLERGVQLQSSDLDKTDRQETVLYVALEDEVVGKLRYVPRFQRDGREMVSRLRKLGVRVVLCSAGDWEELDAIGKRVGLERADIKGGLSSRDYMDRLEHLGAFAFYFSKQTDPALLRQSALTLEVFNELSWDVKHSDVTLFGADLGLVAALFEVVRGLDSIRRQNIIFASLLTPLLLLLACAGLITPVATMGSVFLAALFMYLNAWRLVRVRG